MPAIEALPQKQRLKSGDLEKFGVKRPARKGAPKIRQNGLI